LLLAHFFKCACIRRGSRTTLAALTARTGLALTATLTTGVTALALLTALLAAAETTLTTGATSATWSTRASHAAAKNRLDIRDLLFAQANLLCHVVAKQCGDSHELEFELLISVVLIWIQDFLDLGVHLGRIRAWSTWSTWGTRATRSAPLASLTATNTTLALLTPALPASGSALATLASLAALSAETATTLRAPLRRCGHQSADLGNLVLGHLQFLLDVGAIEDHAAATHATELTTGSTGGTKLAATLTAAAGSGLLSVSDAGERRRAQYQRERQGA